MLDGIFDHWFVAPFTSGGVEQKCFLDNVISEAKKLGIGQGIESFCCNFVPNTKLLEYILIGGGWVPCIGHAFQVFFQLNLGDPSISFAQICENYQAGNLTKSQNGMLHFLEEGTQGGFDDLIMQVFVHIVVQLKSPAIFSVEKDVLGNI